MDDDSQRDETEELLGVTLAPTNDASGTQGISPQYVGARVQVSGQGSSPFLPMGGLAPCLPRMGGTRAPRAPLVLTPVKRSPSVFAVPQCHSYVSTICWYMYMYFMHTMTELMI